MNDSSNTPDKARNTFDPDQHGLWPRFVVRDPDDSRKLSVDTRLWNQTVEVGGYVGDCRHCGAHLRPLATEVFNKIMWYTARCVSCSAEIAAPNGDISRPRRGRRSVR